MKEKLARVRPGDAMTIRNAQTAPVGYAIQMPGIGSIRVVLPPGGEIYLDRLSARAVVTRHDIGAKGGAYVTGAPAAAERESTSRGRSGGRRAVRAPAPAG